MTTTTTKTSALKAALEQARSDANDAPDAINDVPDVPKDVPSATALAALQSGISDQSEYDTATARIRQITEASKEELRTYIIHALTFFHGNGSHNAGILNTIADIAHKASYSTKRVADWIEALAGHDYTTASGVYTFGKKREGVQYDALVLSLPDFLAKYPSWLDYTKPQAVTLLDSEAIGKHIKKLTAELDKQFLMASGSEYQEYTALLMQLRHVVSNRGDCQAPAEAVELPVAA